jgi:hypothetical protein
MTANRGKVRWADQWREVIMAIPLLHTKIYILKRRRELVARPRPSKCLSRGTPDKLVYETHVHVRS